MKLKNVSHYAIYDQKFDNWKSEVLDRWTYDDFVRDPQYKKKWISITSLAYHQPSDAVYLGIGSFSAELLWKFDRKAKTITSCGYEKVFWVPVAPGRSISYSNDLTHVYTRLFRNEGVMPTPLLTAPEYQQGIVYRPYRCPYDTVVMYGYIGPHVASDLQLQHACLALRDAMVLDPVE